MMLYLACLPTWLIKKIITYLADLFNKFNETHLQLQGDDKFFNKRQNLFEENSAENMMKTLTYYKHLDAVHSDFSEQSDDILKLNIPD